MTRLTTSLWSSPALITFSQHLPMVHLKTLLFASVLWISSASAIDLSFQALSIPTRDGKTLAADLYYSDATPQSKPVILIQTPYNKNFYKTQTIPGQAGSMFPISADYNYVVVDWRGFYGSAAAAVAGYDRGLDGYDCVEWIATQPWNNGKVGTWGSSALGFIQFLTARHHPPHLVCCVPRVKGLSNGFTTYYYGGVYRKEHVESMAQLGFVTTASVLAHPTYDNYWQILEATAVRAEVIEVPMLIVGGWYDHFPDDILTTFEDLRTKSPASVRAKHKLILGPWLHSGVGSAQQGELNYPDAVIFDDLKVLKFWDFHLRGVANGWETEPVAQYYRLGEGGWVGADSWAGLARQTLQLNLQSDNSLDTRSPKTAASQSFAYDPNNPTPALGGSRFNPFENVAVGPVDMSSVESRSDVRVFNTPVLQEDLRINGSISVNLQISSNCLDTDFCIRLTDVFPEGKSLLMTQGIRRARFRNSYTTQTLLTPGEITPVTVELQNLALTIQKGHRLRILVCSADFPHYDKNLNDGGPLYVGGAAVIATNTIHTSPDAISNIKLQIQAPTEPPPAPTSLTAIAESSNQVRITWTDVAFSETAWQLEASPNGVDSWTVFANLPTDSTEFLESNLAPGITRHYRVRSQNTAGFSAYSNVASANTPNPNQPPVLQSLVIALPNPALVKQAIAFNANITDADNDPLSFAWDFADGTTSTAAAPYHAFTTAGTFVVSVTASDGRGGSVTGAVTVIVQTGGGATDPIDSDGDGVSDTDEIAAGTNPNDVNSFPAKPLTVLKLQGSTRFNTEGKDSLRISGTLTEIPARFDPNGRVVVLDVGGAVQSWTLDAKGQGKAENETFSIKLKLTRDAATKTKSFVGGDAPFKALLKKGTWSDDWADDGVISIDAKKIPMSIRVKLTFDKTIYAASVDALLSSKAEKNAVFKK